LNIVPAAVWADQFRWSSKETLFNHWIFTGWAFRLL